MATTVVLSDATTVYLFKDSGGGPTGVGRRQIGSRRAIAPRSHGIRVAAS